MKRWMLVVAMLGLVLVAGYARAATNAAPAASEDKTLINYYMSGGVLMHPMSLGLFGVVWLTLYHILVLRKSRLAPAADIAALRVLMYQRDAPGAHAY